MQMFFLANIDGIKYSYVSIKRPVLLKDLFENILKGFY